MGGVPDERDFEGGDVLRWDGIVVFPNASKLAKLVFELPWGAAATQQEKTTRTMKCGNKNNVKENAWGAETKKHNREDVLF